MTLPTASSPRRNSRTRRARALAVGLRTERNFAVPGVPVCLGRLESSDFAPLSPQRKEAVQAFWAEYLNDRGQAPALRFDGTGLLYMAMPDAMANRGIRPLIKRAKRGGAAVIETRLFSLWDGLVGSAALIAIVIFALCVMVGAVKPGDVPRHLGVIVGIVILLIMLPAIIWGSGT